MTDDDSKIDLAELLSNAADVFDERGTMDKEAQHSLGRILQGQGTNEDLERVEDAIFGEDEE
jgi:hypothetical protein